MEGRDNPGELPDLAGEIGFQLNGGALVGLQDKALSLQLAVIPLSL